MVRAPYYDKNGNKKGAWSEEEDYKLRTYILQYGHWNWRQLPKFAGLRRCGKSCRLRWLNYLKPNVKRGNFTGEEDELIIKLYQKHGRKWSLMAASLTGRTDNDIKNHWHTHLKNRINNRATSDNEANHQASTLALDATATDWDDWDSVLKDNYSSPQILQEPFSDASEFWLNPLQMDAYMYQADDFVSPPALLQETGFTQFSPLLYYNDDDYNVDMFFK